MVSLKLIALFALVAVVTAQDYDSGFGGGGDDGGFGGFGGGGGGDGGDDGGFGGGGDEGGFGGGGFGGGDGDDGGFAAAGSAPGQDTEGGEFNFEGAASGPVPIVMAKLNAHRRKRAIESTGEHLNQQTAASKTLIRVRRGHHGGMVGPVYTYVKTDHNGHFKWGARHHVGKHYG